MEYKFYGWERADVPPANDEYKAIKDPRMLYDMLCGIWCADTCAPRLRDRWSEDNKTLGQCSITAFLAQDIFGGKVYGILRSGGNYHCYNVIGDCVFDLTASSSAMKSCATKITPNSSEKCILPRKKSG